MNKIINSIILTAICACAVFVGGCEDDKKKTRCESVCPKCGKRCVYPPETHKHVDSTFGGNNYHKEGDASGDHVWDFNGRYIGSFYYVTSPK